MVRTDDRRERFEALWAAHYEAILAYALRRVPEGQAADVANETFLAAWRRLDERPQSPLPWLYGIARGAVSNQRRSGRRLVALRERIAREPAAAVGEDGPRPVLWEAIRALPPREREAVMLVGWEGLGPEEAALAAGCSRRTFAVRLHRARRRLDERLGRAMSTEIPARPAEKES